MLGTPPKFCASTETGRLGAELPRGLPRGTGKASARFSKHADLGIIRTPFLRLALRTLGIAHSHIRLGR